MNKQPPGAPNAAATLGDILVQVRQMSAQLEALGAQRMALDGGAVGSAPRSAGDPVDVQACLAAAASLRRHADRLCEAIHQFEQHQQLGQAAPEGSTTPRGTTP